MDKQMDGGMDLCDDGGTGERVGGLTADRLTKEKDGCRVEW